MNAVGGRRWPDVPWFRDLRGPVYRATREANGTVYRCRPYDG